MLGPKWDQYLCNGEKKKNQINEILDVKLKAIKNWKDLKSYFYRYFPFIFDAQMNDMTFCKRFKTVF